MAYVAASQDDDEEKKNALGGEADPASGGAGAIPKLGPQAYTQSSFAGAKQIFDKNKNAAQQYDVTQPFSEDLSNSQGALKGSFDKLTSSLGQQVTAQKGQADDLSNAVKQGSQSDSFQRLNQALHHGQVTGTMDPVNSRYSASDVASLNTAPGIQAAIGNQAQKNGVQNYTQGMGALDAAIYQANPQYRQKIADLSKSYADYNKQKEDYNTQTASTIDKSNKELADNAENLKGQLGSQADQIKSSGASGGSVYQNFANQTGQQAKTQAEKQKTDYINKLTTGMTDAEKSKFLNDANKVKSEDFARATGNEAAYDEPSATQFNNIMTLLGRGDRVNAGNTLKSSVDTDKLNAMLDTYARQAKSNPSVSHGSVNVAPLQPAVQPIPNAGGNPKVGAPKTSNTASYQDRFGRTIYYEKGGFMDPNLNTKMRY